MFTRPLYYDAIATATKAGESSPFIEFMLGNILETLKKYKDISLQNGDVQKYELSTGQKKILAMVSQGDMTIELLAKKIEGVRQNNCYGSGPIAGI